jgi:hypothetical protein
MNAITINATSARKSFFDIISSVFANDTVYEVKKSGITVAYISKTRPLVKTAKSLLEAVEELPENNKTLDSEKIVDYIYTARSDTPQASRKVPSLE